MARRADLRYRMAGRVPAAVVVFLAAGLFFIAAPLAAETGCITKECHAAVGRGAYLHGPIAGGMCPICHSVGTMPSKPLPAGHQAVRIESGRGICMECHEEIRVLLKQPFVHTPVAEGTCVDCHAPHNGDNQLFLRNPPIEEKGKRRIAGSCYACHKPESPDWYDEFHAGEATLDCTVCHNPHAAGERFQLTGYVRNIFLQATIAEGTDRLRQGDLKSAVAAYRKALVLNPGDNETRLALGQIYLTQERWEEALKEFDAILARIPGQVDALLGAAKAAGRISGPHAGLKYLHKARESNPNRADIRLETGITYRKLGQMQEAFAEFSRSAEIDPNIAEVHLQLSQMQEIFGHTTEAQRELESYRRLTGKK